MITVSDVNQFMLEFAPLALAEDWDNVGLLVGDPDSAVSRVMTCLTITPDSAKEAIARQADLIVTHHPLPFRPLKRLTTEQTSGRLLLELIKAGIAVISPHTAFDSALNGINAQLAKCFKLSNPRPLIPAENSAELGAGRIAEAASGTTLKTLLDQAKSEFALPQIRFVGSPDSPVHLVGLCCGSGGSFLQTAIQSKCDTLITGEAQFHTCLEAKANEVSLLLLGHHTSERFAVQELARLLSQHFAKLDVWVSEEEEDPISIG
ncbi:MAG: Nif3-like dinuclear metal center hexameric protein [Pirellulaceae bacterium]|nr:Nif3-like dinuclear metal center hexameric protein [Pirellulaceae bacterium]